MIGGFEFGDCDNEGRITSFETDFLSFSFLVTSVRIGAMPLKPVVIAAATAAVIGLIWADETVVMCPGSHTAATGCPDTATCCPHKFSNTGVGCCPFPNAVCCAGSYGQTSTPYPRAHAPELCAL